MLAAYAVAANPFPVPTQPMARFVNFNNVFISFDCREIPLLTLCASQPTIKHFGRNHNRNILAR